MNVRFHTIYTYLTKQVMELFNISIFVTFKKVTLRRITNFHPTCISSRLGLVVSPVPCTSLYHLKSITSKDLLKAVNSIISKHLADVWTIFVLAQIRPKINPEFC